MLDYESLKLVWWILVGVLLIGFALTDGFDLGAAALLPLLGRDDEERRVIINTIAPHWDGNQVWLITAGGALFAAWPLVYAASFSGFYWAMLVVLFALFVRPVGFDYRSKLENTRWRQSWDWGLCIGGLVPALVFGVAFGNLLLGVPIQFDADLRVSYHGNFWQLLNPFGLLAGLVSLSMLCLHGATWLGMRSEGAIAQRSRRAARYCAVLYLASFSAAGLWLWLGDIQGLQLVSAVDGNAASNPLAKQVAVGNPGWLDNYSRQPLSLIAPLLGLAGAALAPRDRRSPRRLPLVALDRRRFFSGGGGGSTISMSPNARSKPSICQLSAMWSGRSAFTSSVPPSGSAITSRRLCRCNFRLIPPVR